MIHNLELEQHLLGALIKYPDKYGEIENFIDESDFYADDNQTNKTIFLALRQCIDQNLAVDHVILAQRIKSFNISFPQNININDYVYSLNLRAISPNQVLSIAKELKKFTIRRSIYFAAQQVAKKIKQIPSGADFEEIIQTADETFNNQINLFDNGPEKPVNIYDEMEEFIEDRGNNPVTEFGLSGPHNRLQELYGSLLRPGNITVVVARSGVGKTRFCMDFCSKVSRMHKVPILHFDNGEMSKEEIITRQASALTGVGHHYLETGLWRQMGDETVDKVRKAFDQIKNNEVQLYYYNVGGYTVDKMIATLKRFYYSTVGRGNPMIFSFDYIKTASDAQNGKSEWQVVGEMVDKFKRTIQKEILKDGEPIIPMITSVQSNRSGVVNNRRAENIVDDESIVSLSDRITQFCSHMFILRKKTLDEIEDEPNFGTHKLINVKARHLGKSYNRATEPVRMPDDSLKPNVIHLQMDAFTATEIGDQKDLSEAVGAAGEIERHDRIDDPIPEFIAN
jgi:replicative DNA helicase